MDEHNSLENSSKKEQNTSELNRQFIRNSVDLVLKKLCPDYPIKERQGYFKYGNFFIMINLQNTKNQLIVGMVSDHGMGKELLELTFIFTENGGFEIIEYPETSINNLVFKFFIELRKELERKRLLKARAGKWGRFFLNFKEKVNVKDRWEV